MTRAQFAALASVFRPAATKTDTEQAFNAYLRALNDLPPPALERAISAALKTCRRMPPPAELRDLASHSGPSPGLTTSRRFPDGCELCGGQPYQATHPVTGAPWRYRLEHLANCQLYQN
jgi:hypothetical protein